jgi:8-oxo-dGTP pyrophosphatase MutT (NUDIX family)
VKTRSSRIVYENRWIAVREDTVERADGSSGIYGVLEKRDFALAIPLDGDRLWLVEQYRYPIERRLWEFPQGTWDGEPGGDAAALARTELQEEAGLVAGSLEHLGYLHQAPGVANFGFDVFLATQLERVEPKRSIEEQDMRAAAFSLAEFERMARSGAITDAPTIAAWGLLGLARP